MLRGGWRELRDEQGDQLKKMKCGDHVAGSMGWGMRGADKISGEISEGTRTLGRPRRKWEDNINMDFI
jgi:hypothetical protein